MAWYEANPRFIRSRTVVAVPWVRGVCRCCNLCLQACVEEYIRDAEWWHRPLDAAAQWALRHAHIMVKEAVFCRTDGHVANGTSANSSAFLVRLIQNLERARQVERDIRLPEGLVPCSL